ncbi:MAG: exosome complex RNA-binding protein Rrp4 [archaeon]|nr:exosome complex protein Rrp4 [Nanoarchaeota archaeon]
MSEILVENKNVVIPGEILAKGMDYLPGDNTYREGEQILSKSVGLVTISGRVIKVTPLGGAYRPRVGDKIIGLVFDITMSGWRIKTNTAYPAMLNVKDATTRFVRKDEDLSKILAVGDYVVVKIIRVTSQNLIDLSMSDPDLYKINGGRIININPQKVPRVIGKQGSMVSVIKRYCNCDITVGQNGLILIRAKEGGDEYLAEQAVKLVEKESHRSGLTERIEAFLKDQGANAA